MTKELEARSAGVAASLNQIEQTVHSDLQYVSLQVDGKPYGGWYRLLPDGRMELLALANVHCERRPEKTAVEQARGMLADFIRAARTDGRAAADAPASPSDPEQSTTQTTLGDLLYVDKAKSRIPEDDWADLVKLIAARDQLALDQLFERTHRIVYTLIVRLIGKPEIAEELTLDVFQDIWRQASHFDAANGPVLAWLLNQSRLRTIEWLQLERSKRSEAADLQEQGSRLRNAVTALSVNERQLIETAYFSRSTLRELAAQRQQPVEAVTRDIHCSLEKLLEKLEGER